MDLTLETGKGFVIEFLNFISTLKLYCSFKIGILEYDICFWWVAKSFTVTQEDDYLFII